MKHPKKRPSKKHLVPIGVVLAVIAVLVLVLLLSQAKRRPDAAAFCNLYQSTYKTTPDRKDEIKALKELEQLAPDEIYQELHAVREAKEKVEKDPTGALAIETGVYGSSLKLQQWVQRCGEEKARVTFCDYYEKHERPEGDLKTTVTWLSDLQKHSMTTQQLSKSNDIISDYNDAQRMLDSFGDAGRPSHDRSISQAEQAIPEFVKELDNYCSKSLL